MRTERKDDAMRQISVLGDSISTFAGWNPPEYAVYYDADAQQRNGLQSVQDTWWAQVEQALGATHCANNSYSGSRVTGPGFPAACSLERTSALHSDTCRPDWILVYIGFNDFGYGVPVRGGLEAGVPATDRFYHAYLLMLDRIQQFYPEAAVYCGTLMRGYLQGQPELVFPEWYAGHYLSDYNEAIRTACRQQGQHLVDLAASCHRYETLDGTHPTAVGHRQIAAEWLALLQKR